MVLAAVPVKRFFVAKRRLAPVLDADARSGLGRGLALHTLEAIDAAGAEAMVLAADEEVADWAKHHGFAAIVDQGDGLDEAAAAAALAAVDAGVPWMVVHADLPLLTPADIEASMAALAGSGAVIAPSNDGGTSLVGGLRPIRFAYGPGSFHRHLAALGAPEVVVRIGLALDLDDPSDLRAALARPEAAWLRRHAGERVTDLYDDLAGDPDAPSVPASALTIGAHPDDAEFGAGGTLAGWATAGCEVTMLVVTDGSKGTWDPGLDRDTLVASRRREQRAAADALGAGDVIHLDHVDGELEYSMDLRAELCRWIRTVRPEVVLTHDPWRRYMLHPDHRVAGTAVLDGVVAARDHLFFPDQGLDKHRPDAVLLWQADEPDHRVDIAATFDVKIDALLCHSTQTSTTMGDAASSPDARAAFVARMAALAAEHGAPAGLAAAEAFKLIRP